MDPEYANYYTREVMLILIREFQSPDEEMKKIVLKVPNHLFIQFTYMINDTYPTTSPYTPSSTPTPEFLATVSLYVYNIHENF